MTVLAPSVSDQHFDDVDSLDEQAVQRRLEPWVRRELHPFLNSLPCLHDLQDQRRRQGVRAREQEAFGTFKADPFHWYSFNHGGRNEAQFNVGMFPDYLRVGLGFEFTEKQGGNPKNVLFAYSTFRGLIRGRMRSEFINVADENRLEIEYGPDISASEREHIPTAEVPNWDPRAMPRWIFYGRLLRREEDRTILEDPEQLGAVMRSVLCGLHPFWSETMREARMVLRGL